MKFRELHDLCNSICEHHWEEDNSLTVIVNAYEFDDFMKVLRNHKGIFDEHISAFIGDGYVSVPNFDRVLEYLGVEKEDIKDIFEEEDL